MSFTQGIHHNKQTVRNDLSDPLSLDEAYLILRNTNHSDTITLFGNKIECESCDLVKMIVAVPNKNVTRIINTKYAYNLELRSSSSNTSLLCQISSYKFAEHGTYVVNFMRDASDTNMCSIEQIGNLSYYLTPAILGILFVILYTVLVQISSYIHRPRSCDSLREDPSHQRLIDANLVRIPLGSPENVPKQSINVSDDDIIQDVTSTSKLPLASSTHLSNNKIRVTRVFSKRLRALDTFRGFSLMVMIFVNYGGTCLIFRLKMG